MEIAIGLGVLPTMKTGMHAGTAGLLILLAPAPLTAGTVITAVAENGTPLSMSGGRYEWRRDGVLLPAPGTASYTLSAADLNALLSVRAVSDSGDPIAESPAMAVSAGALQIAPLNRDRIVLGTATGLPLSGTAAPGAAIAARAVLEGGAGGSWQVIATAAPDGSWAGTLLSPASTGWHRAELRIEETPGLVTRLPQRFARGHVIDLWGQSELHRAVRATHPGVSPPPAITDPEALQVSYSDADGASYGSALTHAFVDGSDARLAGKLGALANMLAAEHPGEKFHIVFHTLSATGARALVDDTSTSRQWAQDMALKAFALPDGQQPGLAIQSWYNADSGALRVNYGDFWLEIISGLTPAGSPSTAYDHYFSEIYDYGVTRWAIAGPHRFETAPFDGTIPANVAGLTAAFGNSILSDRAIRVLEPLSYANGVTDPIHPDSDDPDGTSRFMVQMGYAMLQGLGLVSWDTPRITNATYDAGTLTLTSSAGPITTTRAERGEALPAGRPPVAGIYVNGSERLTGIALTGGAIVVTGLAEGDVVQVNTDAVGEESQIADGVWKDYPLVDLGQLGLEGIPLRQGYTVPGDVIPAASIPADPNTNPNLLAAAVSQGTAGQPGVFRSDASWSVPEDGSFAESGVANADIELRDNTNNANVFNGKDLEISFVLTTPDGGRGSLQVLVTGKGGGTTTLLNTTFLPLRGGRNTLAIPAQIDPARSIFSILFRRRNGGETTTGIYVISDLTVKEIVP